MKGALEGAVSVVIAVAIFSAAWSLSASTIAFECNLLGQFYVGKTVYKCEVKS